MTYQINEIIYNFNTFRFLNYYQGDNNNFCSRIRQFKMKSSISQARINQQIRNMLKQPLPNLKATPLQNDIYTWHFTIQGPQNSDFHEGLYHGQILLPFEYPFKPPDIIFMNKNARFQTNTKICLTITQYHPEEWNSAWTIRTMLQAVISLFNQNIQGIGYEEGSPEQRRLLARRSHDYNCDKCGVLKDLLAPREPRKEQEKKQEMKNQLNVNIPTGEKLEYASEKEFRKTKIEEKSTSVPRKMSRGQTEKKARQQRKSQAGISQIRKQQEEQHVEQDKFRGETNQSGQNPTYRICSVGNNAIALDQKIQRNYVSWARVLKSQKWSVIE